MESVIVVVDDDPLVRMLTSTTLEDAGFNVIEVADAEEAKRTIEASSRPIQTVVTDIRMPGSIDGLDLAQWIVETRPTVRVIVTSGYAENIRSRLPDQVAFLSKPWTGERLLGLVSNKGSRTAHR